MRDQYAGDISDLLKFAFLRALAGRDRTLGIAWYYVAENDGRPDGRHLEWRKEAGWKLLDAELHQKLASLPERNIAALEKIDIWPHGTLFHREAVPPASRRMAWGAQKRQALEGADIVFLDPDNGLGLKPKKHATFSEVRLLRRPGRSIVFISFPHRNMKHDQQVQCLHKQLLEEAGAQSAVTLRTSVSLPRADHPSYRVPRLRWFTLVDADSELEARAATFADALSSISYVRAALDHSI